MTWNETRYARIGETVLRTTLPNGLPLTVVPKPHYRKRYAFFTTRYGGMDMRFCRGGTWYDTPAGIAHYLEPEKPAEDKPAAATDDALTILESIWNTYSDEEKFPAAGGDADHAVDGAPGSFDVSNADSLGYMLTFPTDDASLLDSAASLVHMMNLNTFTCGAFHAADAQDVTKLADDLHTTVQAKHWMCGFPEKLVIVTVRQCVISVYGNEELVNTFRDKLLASYSAAAAVYDEAINA